jgi:hypothetical protein
MPLGPGHSLSSGAMAGESHKSLPQVAPLCGRERLAEAARGSSARGPLLLSLCLLIGGRREGAKAVGCGLSGMELYMELYMEDMGVVGAAEW